MFLRIMSYQNPLNIDIQVPKDHLRTKLTKKTDFFSKMERQSLHQHSISQEKKLTKKELVELEYREQYRGYSLTHLYPNQYSISSDQTNSIYAECSLSSTIFQMALIICEIGNLLRQRTLFSVNFTFVKI